MIKDYSLGFLTHAISEFCCFLKPAFVFCAFFSNLFLSKTLPQFLLETKHLASRLLRVFDTMLLTGDIQKISLILFNFKNLFPSIFHFWRDYLWSKMSFVVSSLGKKVFESHAYSCDIFLRHCKINEILAKVSFLHSENT